MPDPVLGRKMVAEDTDKRVTLKEEDSSSKFNIQIKVSCVYCVTLNT